MPWTERKKIIKKGWLFNKKETYFEQVDIVAQRDWRTVIDGDTDSGTEYLVKNKDGKMYIASYIYR
jgi:hypothetical protein